MRFLKGLTAAAVAGCVLWLGSVPGLALTLPAESADKLHMDALSPQEKITAAGIVNEKGEPINTIGANFKASLESQHLTLDGVNPNQTFYIYFGGISDPENTTGLLAKTEQAPKGAPTDRVAAAYDLMDERLFDFSAKRVGVGSSVVFDVYPVAAKSIGTFIQSSWLKVVLRDDLTAADQRVVLDLTFRAKRDAVDNTGSRQSNTTSATYKANDFTTMRLTLWVKNTQVEGQVGSSDASYSFVFEPAAGATNTLVWGDNDAQLEFHGDTSGRAFYGRMSTASDMTFYTQYGAPAGAEMWFFDFVGNPSIPTTSLATLTLGYPWDEEFPVKPDPAGCRIYQRTPYGTYDDVTDQFTLDMTGDFPGWRTRTRVLGSYCISDTDLGLNKTEDKPIRVEGTEVPVDVKVPANTGLPDKVFLCVLGGIVALGAAGFVALHIVSDKSDL